MAWHPDIPDEYKNSIVTGDALSALTQLPANSINLIVTDPPYFRVKDAEWDNQWKSNDEYLNWLEQVLVEFGRVLMKNGSLYLFASPDMSRHVENLVAEHFNVLNSIRWVKKAGWHKKIHKEDMRQFLQPWEAIIFAEQVTDSCNPIASRLYQARIDAGLTCDYIEREMGYIDNKGRGSRLFYRWECGDSLPTQDDFCQALSICGSNGTQQKYEDLCREYEALRRECEDLRRPFNAASDRPNTDVWTFPTVQSYEGKHPCEKPLAMIEHIIRTSSCDGDTVLDCFAGSGVTGEACIGLDRKYILVDQSEYWCEQAQKRCKATQYGMTLKEYMQGKQPLFDLQKVTETAPEQAELGI